MPEENSSAVKSFPADAPGTGKQNICAKSPANINFEIIVQPLLRFHLIICTINHFPKANSRLYFIFTPKFYT